MKHPIFVLVLQHPQEKNKKFNTARLLVEQLERSQLKVGLSLRNLRHCLKGTEIDLEKLDPKKWSVLYLGSKKELASVTEELEFTDQLDRSQDQLVFVDSKGKHIPAPGHPIEGLVLLDGNWKQSKTLWWRNPWLLKLNRVMLIPAEESRYRELRRAPRKENLSTIESAAMALGLLHESTEVPQQLQSAFENFVQEKKTTSCP